MTFAAEPITSRGVPDLSFLLTHASHVLATRMTAAFAEIGITPREYCVLAHAMGGSHTQIELSKLADGSRVSELLGLTVFVVTEPGKPPVAYATAQTVLVFPEAAAL